MKNDRARFLCFIDFSRTQYDTFISLPMRYDEGLGKIHFCTATKVPWLLVLITLLLYGNLHSYILQAREYLLCMYSFVISMGSIRSSNNFEFKTLSAVTCESLSFHMSAMLFSVRNVRNVAARGFLLHPSCKDAIQTCVRFSYLLLTMGRIHR